MAAHGFISQTLSWQLVGVYMEPHFCQFDKSGKNYLTQAHVIYAKPIQRNENENRKKSSRSVAWVKLNSRPAYDDELLCFHVVFSCFCLEFLFFTTRKMHKNTKKKK